MPMKKSRENKTDDTAARCINQKLRVAYQRISAQKTKEAEQNGGNEICRIVQRLSLFSLLMRSKAATCWRRQWRRKRTRKSVATTSTSAERKSKYFLVSLCGNENIGRAQEDKRSEEEEESDEWRWNKCGWK
jgi:hypothetical protein